MSEWGSSHNYNKTQQPIEFFDASQYSQNQGHEHNAVGWDSHAPLHQGGYASNDMYGKIENKPSGISKKKGLTFLFLAIVLLCISSFAFTSFQISSLYDTVSLASFTGGSNSDMWVELYRERHCRGSMKVYSEKSKCFCDWSFFESTTQVNDNVLSVKIPPNTKVLLFADCVKHDLTLTGAKKKANVLQSIRNPSDREMCINVRTHASSMELLRVDPKK